MHADDRRLVLDKTTRKIIQCAFRVQNALGCGFLEKVYENALLHELPEMGLQALQCINYLKASGLPVALLFNFGVPRLEVKRVVNRF